MRAKSGTESGKWDAFEDFMNMVYYVGILEDAPADFIQECYLHYLADLN
jgi:hypothetical protein